VTRDLAAAAEEWWQARTLAEKCAAAFPHGTRDLPPLADARAFLPAGATVSQQETAHALDRYALTSVKFNVVAAIRAVGPSTDRELERRLQLKHQTVSARRRELVLHGWLAWTGELRRVPGVRSTSMLWDLTPSARAAWDAQTAGWTHTGG